MRHASFLVCTYTNHREAREREREAEAAYTSHRYLLLADVCNHQEDDDMMKQFQLLCINKVKSNE